MTGDRPTVFATGSTGLLGAEMLINLARQRPRPRILALVRGRTLDEAAHILKQKLLTTSDQLTTIKTMAALELVLGDIMSPESLSDPRLDEVTHVAHLAADTSFWNTPAIDPVNIQGTMNVADRARRMKKLTRFVYIGTAFAYGRTPDLVVPEVPFQEIEPDSLVRYTRTKARAEASLATAFLDLPLVTVRPSVIAGHTRNGLMPTPAIFWFYFSAARLRLLSSPLEGSSVDNVPADWAGAGLARLVTKSSLKARVYHLTGGKEGRSYWSDTVAACCALFGVPYEPDLIDQFEPDGEHHVLRERFKQIYGFGDSIDRLMLRTCQLYYRFMRLNTVFDNSNLLAEGIKPPPTIADLVPVCAEHRPAETERDLFIIGESVEEHRAWRSPSRLSA